MVDQRHPALEPDRHGGAVDLGENVVRQIGDEIEELHARDEIREVARQRRIPQGPCGSLPRAATSSGRSHWLTSRR